MFRRATEGARNGLRTTSPSPGAARTCLRTGGRVGDAVAGMGRRGSREWVRLGADGGCGGCRSPADGLGGPGSRLGDSPSSVSAPPRTQSPARSWSSTSSRSDRCAARHGESEAGPCCSQARSRAASPSCRPVGASSRSHRPRGHRRALGLLWWSRDRVLELTRPFYVAPNHPSRVPSCAGNRGRRRSRAAASRPDGGPVGRSPLPAR